MCHCHCGLATSSTQIEMYDSGVSWHEVIFIPNSVKFSHLTQNLMWPNTIPIWVCWVGVGRTESMIFSKSDLSLKERERELERILRHNRIRADRIDSHKWSERYFMFRVGRKRSCFLRFLYVAHSSFSENISRKVNTWVWRELMALNILRRLFIYWVMASCIFGKVICWPFLKLEIISGAMYLTAKVTVSAISP